ncbi:MAG: HEAT repeat domain-containing protein, partial [Thermogemmata sp.]|nr:HEAT repeat domain-containing protein [Thermogemmata sp.]
MLVAAIGGILYYLAIARTSDSSSPPDYAKTDTSSSTSSAAESNSRTNNGTGTDKNVGYDLTPGNNKVVPQPGKNNDKAEKGQKEKAELHEKVDATPKRPSLPKRRDDVPQLIKVLQEGEENDRLEAARLLASTGVQARWAIPYMIQIVETAPPALGQEVYNALVAIGPPEPAQEHLLKQCLQSPNHLLRNYAITMYAAGTPILPRDLLPTVVRMLEQDQAKEARLKFLSAIAHLGNFALPLAVGAVIECLADADEEVRLAAKQLMRDNW